MNKKQYWLGVITFVVVLFSIYFGGFISFAAEDKYSIIFDANGGNFGKDNEGQYITQVSLEVDKGTSVSLSTYYPVREGYEFLGWKKSNSSDNNYFNYGYSVPNGDTTYIAGWIKIYNVTFEANGGYFGKITTIDGDIINSEPIIKTYREGDVLFFHNITIPQRDNYVFLGYKSVDGVLLSDQSNGYKITKDMVFYAQWKEAITVKYEDGDLKYKYTYYLGQKITVGHGEKVVRYVDQVKDTFCVGW